jgi:hypothetical protein
MGQKQAIAEYDLPENHGLAILGHELGNVLHGLLGMAELLGESSLTPDQCQWLRAIEHSGQQMASLIQSAGSRAPSAISCLTPQPSRVDGVEILEQVVMSHTPAARSVKNQLILLVDPGMHRYWCMDACLVRQLLDNLVGNANKFTQQGQIVIEAASVSLAGREGEAIRLRVSDTGSGFESAVAEKLFGAYRRFSDTCETATGNRGLGLYICQNIAEAMNGQLSCARAQGGGAVFEVVLPGATDRFVARLPDFRSGLFDHLHCRLRLNLVLKKSVENFLTRLGVRFSEIAGGGEPPPSQVLDILISVAAETAVNQPCLLLTTISQSGTQRRQKTLESPLLESSLGGLLLEMALEWRGQLLRNESPDSIPKPR